MTHPNAFNLIVIGDRINPGFKSIKTLIENDDLAGIQAMAVRQVEAGAHYLDVTIGPRAVNDPDFMAKTIRAIQDVVTVPLCFDFPTAAVQAVCLSTYDRARANGALPLINSITEHRWDIMDLYKTHGPFKVIVMASERVDNGVAKPNKTAEEIITTARRALRRWRRRCSASTSRRSSRPSPPITSTSRTPPAACHGRRSRARSRRSPAPSGS